MANRISRRDVDASASTVSSMLHGLEVRAESRYGYIGLDLYDASGCVRTLRSGLSTRAAYEYLHAMAQALEIVGRS